MIRFRVVFGESFDIGVDVSSIGGKFYRKKGSNLFLLMPKDYYLEIESLILFFSIDTLEHIINPQKVLSELYRVAKVVY